MRCSVKGFPEPHVTWFKDNVRLHHSKRFQISEQPYYLVVNDATPEDSGKYTCRASNGIAYFKDEANVVIKLDDKTFY
ncbi:telokin-like [Drosophila takahashii]|uniref:telokin-like n=1 Tax=Drosophila takahashii TaxID=29030 RepID=UPI0038990CEE